MAPNIAEAPRVSNSNTKPALGKPRVVPVIPRNLERKKAAPKKHQGVGSQDSGKGKQDPVEEQLPKAELNGTSVTSTNGSFTPQSVSDATSNIQSPVEQTLASPQSIATPEEKIGLQGKSPHFDVFVKMMCRLHYPKRMHLTEWCGLIYFARRTNSSAHEADEIAVEEVVPDATPSHDEPTPAHTGEGPTATDGAHLSEADTATVVADKHNVSNGSTEEHGTKERKSNKAGTMEQEPAQEQTGEQQLPRHEAVQERQADGFRGPPLSIPSHLPPTFHPHEHQSTPSSAASLHHQEYNPMSTGFAEGSNPSSGRASGFGYHPMAMTAPPVTTVAFYPTHPAAQFPVYPVLGHGSMHFNPEANFFPHGAQYQSMPISGPMPNGDPMSRSVSQISGHSHDMRESLQSRGSIVNGPALPGTFTPAHVNGAFPAVHGFNGIHPAFSPMASQTSDTESAVQTCDYLLQQFGNSASADFMLNVMDGISASDGDNPVLLFSLPLHRLLLARSPALAAATSTGSISYTPDKFFHRVAFVDALKSLYGAPLLDAHVLGSTLPPVENTENGTHATQAQSLMLHALGYTSAGLFLQLPALIGTGLQAARHITRWENVQIALSFGLHHNSDADVQLFFHDTLHFMITHLPANFTFFKVAPQAIDFQRLPTAGEPMSSRPNPRVSGLTFGELSFGPKEPEAIDPASGKFSSILITLPFPVLKQLLQDSMLVEKLGAEKVKNLARDVVAEREGRRHKALKAKGVKSAADGRFAAALRCEEKFEESQNGEGFTLSCVDKADHKAEAE